MKRARFSEEQIIGILKAAATTLTLRSMLRKRTRGSLRKALRLDIESAVEAGAKVLPRDRGREFDELLVGQIRAKSRQQSVVD